MKWAYKYIAKTKNQHHALNSLDWKNEHNVWNFYRESNGEGWELYPK